MDPFPTDRSKSATPALSGSRHMAKTSRDQCGGSRRELDLSPWFKQLSPEFRETILAQGALVNLKSGERLFSRADDPDGIYAVLQGAIEVGSIDAAGKVATLTIAQVGTWFGEISIVDGLPRTHDATALEASRLWRIPRLQLLAFLTRRPESWREIALLLTEKLRLSFSICEDSARLSALQRVAARLVMISEGYGGVSLGQAQIRLSQSQLAGMLNVSRQTINQCLKSLEQRRLISIGHAHIAINDLALLKLVFSTAG